MSRRTCTRSSPLLTTRPPRARAPWWCRTRKCSCGHGVTREIRAILVSLLASPLGMGTAGYGGTARWRGSVAEVGRAEHTAAGARYEQQQRELETQHDQQRPSEQQLQQGLEQCSEVGLGAQRRSRGRPPGPAGFWAWVEAARGGVWPLCLRRQQVMDCLGKGKQLHAPASGSLCSSVSDCAARCQPRYTTALKKGEATVEVCQPSSQAGQHNEPAPIPWMR